MPERPPGGLIVPPSAASATAYELTVARTLRTRLIAVPARLLNHAGTPRWRGPLNWPWAELFTRALTQLRALLPAPT